jgi:ParB family chromosome partitioning protein
MEQSTAKKKSSLGRGLGALLGDSSLDIGEKVKYSSQGKEQDNSASATNISTIDVNMIESNPYQPRKEFDRAALEELADSIRTHGIIIPITVRRLSDNAYQLIAGERRLLASKMVGLDRIPAYVRTADDQQMLEMGLIENIQRENLNAIEIAAGFQRLIDECALKQEEIGERVGKKRSTVNNYLRLLKLPADIQAGIKENKISMGHARALINIEGGVDKQLAIFNRIISDDLSVRKVEELVRQLAEGGDITEKSNVTSTKKNNTVSNPELQRIQGKLTTHFGTKVSLNIDKNQEKGEIRIAFMSTEDLNRILEILQII